MKLTKKEAIEISIELWEWLAETGSAYKFDWPGWEKYGEMKQDCPLCEYTTLGTDITDCDLCPYNKKFGLCLIGPTPRFYGRWEDAKTPKTRKKYAHLFLKQLKQLEVNDGR